MSKSCNMLKWRVDQVKSTVLFAFYIYTQNIKDFESPIMIITVLVFLSM